MNQTNVQRTAIVPYSPAQMYALVNDVTAYPRFLPWCRSAKVLSKKDNELCASIEFAKGSLRKSFSTCNSMKPNKEIMIKLKEGPFKQLYGTWLFTDMDGHGTKIAFSLSFQFANRLIEVAIGPIFNHIANTMVDAFCKRASQVYGIKNIKHHSK